MIEIPASYNYCSAFLTFACNLKCPYCINKYNGLYKYDHMEIDDWVEGLRRIRTTPDLPITLSGGEPTLYRGFCYIINRCEEYFDVLTNGEFDPRWFASKVEPNRLWRGARYSSIRFSYHPHQTNPVMLLLKVRYLLSKGYSVGIWAVDNKDPIIRRVGTVAKLLGIDFRLKEFLDDKHGSYKYPAGLDGKRKTCLCKPSELLIAPDGRLFRCHYDLYHGVNSYGHILDKKVNIPTDFIPCNNYGLCSPCDLKLKFNRFQEHGHCSVEIIDG